MIVIAIDPGTANTGVAVYDSEAQKVIDCVTIKTKSTGQDQMALNDRCWKICIEISGAISEIMFDDFQCEIKDAVTVVEGFASFGGNRQNANTFQTPFLVGYLCAKLYPDSIQTSNKVFNKYGRSVRDSIKDGTCSVEGCQKATNDHERSALCHALYYANGGW